MATAPQIAANRRNARASAGPKSPEGKDASKFNGLEHGVIEDNVVDLSMAGMRPWGIELQQDVDCGVVLLIGIGRAQLQLRQAD